MIAHGAGGASRCLLSADEPPRLGCNDPGRRILALMAELQRAGEFGRPLIIQTWVLVAEVCDAVGVMVRGQVVEKGDVPAQIFATPRHLHPGAPASSPPGWTTAGAASNRSPGWCPAPPPGQGVRCPPLAASPGSGCRIEPQSPSGGWGPLLRPGAPAAGCEGCNPHRGRLPSSIRWGMSGPGPRIRGPFRPRQSHRLEPLLTLDLEGALPGAARRS